MDDLYTPSLSYEFALRYVQLYNAPPWEPPETYQPQPINLADVYQIIGDYLRQNAALRYQKVTFHQFLHQRVTAIRAERDTMIACEPHDGLHEFRIVQMAGQPWLIFPADLNSGWQSPQYHALLLRHTMFHGYVLLRDQAVRLHDFVVYWQDSLNVLLRVEKMDAREDNDLRYAFTTAMNEFHTRHPYA